MDWRVVVMQYCGYDGQQSVHQLPKFDFKTLTLLLLPPPNFRLQSPESILSTSVSARGSRLELDHRGTHPPGHNSA